jgi:hypothetical protein
MSAQNYILTIKLIGDENPPMRSGMVARLGDETPLTKEQIMDCMSKMYDKLMEDIALL